ncbi:MAG: DUF2235 domain-containing protein [Xanthomonadaceae bacterium]|nr:DUF2235 domain-containing protein [Xanthomonadaceae bacterium]
MTTQDETRSVLPAELVHGHEYVIDPETGRKSTLDGTPYAAVNPDDVALIEAGERKLADLQVPVLAGKDDPNAFVFFAVLDGTGNDTHDPNFAPTGVAQIYEQLDDQIEAGYGNGRIAAAYVTGTQTRADDNMWDGAEGYSAADRAETMYVEFCKQAAAWRDENPGAEISLASMGFSRGAEEAVLLGHLVHERGIHDPKDITYEITGDGLVKAGTVTFKQPEPAIAAGDEVKQSLIAIDPVSEGDLKDGGFFSGGVPYGVAPTVVGGVQLTARDETRRAFIGTEHIKEGLSEDGTRANIVVPGAHADVGDGYYANGLGVRYTNMAKNYINDLVDFEKPLLTLNPVDTNLGLGSTNVIHDSHMHSPGPYLYDNDEFRERGGRIAEPPTLDSRPMDSSLAENTRYRAASPEPAPTPDSWATVGNLYDPKDGQEATCTYHPSPVEVSSPESAPSNSTHQHITELREARCEAGLFAPVEKTEPAPPLETEKVMATDAYGTPIGMYPIEMVPSDRVADTLPMSAHTHPAFPMYSEAWNAMADPAKTNIPSGNMSENDRARAAAAVTAAAMTGPPPLDHINGVFLNKSGDTLIAIEGNPTDPASKRVMVPLETAVKTPVEESTQKAVAAMEEQQQKGLATPNNNLQPSVASTARAQ